MEEKERYTYFACGCCVDNQDNLNIVNCLERLNEQDKKIKELNEQLKTKGTINNLYKTTISLRDGDFKDLVYENNDLKQEIQKLKASKESLKPVMESKHYLTYNKTEFERQAIKHCAYEVVEKMIDSGYKNFNIDIRESDNLPEDCKFSFVKKIIIVTTSIKRGEI